MFTMKKGHRPPPAFGPGELPPMDGHGNIIMDQEKFREPLKAGFDQAAFDASLSGITARENRELCEKYQDEMAPEVLAYWEKLGVKKELFDAVENGGKGKYSVHTPLVMVENKKYPLLYFSHAGFGTPFQAETAGFSKLIETEQFIAVYPNNGGYSNEDVATEFPRILDQIRKKGYPIDWTRVYACGFSSGSDATETIGTLWPELVAAVAPCPGSNAMYNSLCRVTKEAYEKCLPLQVPMLCVGGAMDFGDAYPFPDRECIENFNIWAKYISKVKDYQELTFEQSQAIAQNAEDAAKAAVGLDFQKTWSQHFEERDWHFGEFYDAQDRPVIRFVIGEGVPHIMTGCFAALVWDYLKHWSKDPASGEPVYTPVVISGVN
ncbi:MAG: hypothetical protein ACI3XJ_01275 [Oscillospiraceae bacterium]